MNIKFNFPNAPSKPTVCVPRFFSEFDTPGILNCIHENARFLVSRWGKEATDRVLDALRRDPIVSCDSAGLVDVVHVHAIHEAIELLVRDTVPQAVFGRDTLFLRDADGMSYGDIVRHIERIRRFLKIPDAETLEVWAVMPGFETIIIAATEYARRDDDEVWLGNAWNSLSEDGKRDVARALRDATRRGHLSDTLIASRMGILERLSAPFCSEPLRDQTGLL
jgi:hypothetical protein